MAADDRGFTLLELVVGMVVLAIALVMLATLVFPQAERAAHSLYQVRAAQLGQAVMGELMGRRFDQATPSGGGAVTSLNCSKVTAGDEPTRWSFVEDYNGYRGNAAALLGSSAYDRFQLEVDVSCTAAVGSTDWPGGAKIITITAVAPDGSRYPFQLVRGNY
ncbi:type II secretion system protein [Ferrimonas sediminicola]|uniref:Type II secretion system protein n=1 Tax=Ferrimonas sediminicola TaxID=2569538 RepID=A0A4U1BK74_9GAMM|nr:type II secretion system protein [Ferrimonas sediminicola]TKB51214.1 type II secretion system protein [Ferrimonas sediminicola]